MTENVSDCLETSPAPAQVAIVCGALLRRQLKGPDEISASRSLLAGLVIVLASLLWVATFIILKLEKETLPWSSVFMATAAILLSSMLASRRINPLSLLRFGEMRKITFTDSFAISFVGTSLLFTGWLAFHHYHPAEPMLAKRQVVDIELVSPSDYADRHDPLPGTKEKEQERKRIETADKTIQSSTLAQRVSTVQREKDPLKDVDKDPQPSLPTTKHLVQARDNQRIHPKAQEKGDDQRFVVSTQKVDGTKASAEKVLAGPPLAPTIKARRPDLQSNHETPMLEEVSAPEMVEITDNDGDHKSEQVWQPGGHSTGGEGAQTSLVPYLKELHRRIKHAWSPPANETRSAQILFRIKKDGRLSSVSLVRSSGFSDADASAMEAITHSSPFKPLPHEYTAAYLDLLYTFNLNVDQLTEVPSPGTE